MKEANMQTFWTKHVSKRPPSSSQVWELKFTSKNAIRFDAVKKHQREALLNAKTYGVYHKITDPPVFYGMQTRFNAKRPFDCIFLKHVDSYVLVWFYKPRQKKVFIKIDIDDFLKMEAAADRKSFTEEMALEAGTPVEIVK